MWEPLTFTSVDGLAFAAERGNLIGSEGSPHFAVGDLGPFLEYLLLANGGLLPVPRSAPWLRLNGSLDLYQALSNRRHLWVCSKTRQTGLFRTYQQVPSDYSSWNQFCIAAQHAAVAAGFPKGIAAQLAGALGEMEGNIYEHSKASKSGVLVFRATSGSFEFVVADRGIGVLRSLKSSPDFAHLADHGEALRLTLTDGVSRFGTGGDRGHGFRSLFRGLANLNGALRFRSGDHALTIHDQSPNLLAAKLGKKTEVPGFFVSVKCRVQV